MTSGRILGHFGSIKIQIQLRISLSLNIRPRHEKSMTQRTILLLLAPLLSIAFFLVASDSHPLVETQRQAAVTPTPSPSPTSKETWWQKLLRITGLSANPGAQRSPSNTALVAGEIWITNLVISNTGVKLAGGIR